MLILRRIVPRLCTTKTKTEINEHEIDTDELILVIQ